MRKKMDFLMNHLGIPPTEPEKEPEFLSCPFHPNHSDQEPDPRDPPTCPVKILCVHPILNQHIQVHWKITARLPMSGYEVCKIIIFKFLDCFFFFD